MTDIMNGIFVWTGDFGVGKTTAALECGAKPEEIIFVDADIKGNKTIEDLRRVGVKFGDYINLVQVINERENFWDAYEFIIGIINKITPKIKVVIFDPETIIYDVFRAYVSRNLNEFDSPKAWAKSKGSGFQFYEGKISRHAREAEQAFFNLIAGKVQAIHLTAHLKDKYDGGVAVGQIPSISPMIHRIANMICWLQHSPVSTTPVMLFVKQYGKKVITSEGKIRTVNITPRKAVPHEGESSVWDILERYVKQPAHNREPLPEEIITEDEQWIVDKVLSDFQKEAWFARIKAKEAEERALQAELESVGSPLQVRVQELQAEGLVAPPMIRDKILAEISEGKLEGVNAALVTMDTIAKLMNTGA